MGVRIEARSDVLGIFHDAAQALGLIFMYSGNVASIPAGWHLCDGNAGTKDLRNRFVAGAEKDTGGSATCSLTGADLAFGGSTTTATGNANVTDTGHDHAAGITTGITSGTDFNCWEATSSSATGYAAVSDIGHDHTTVQPFYALAFIQAV